ncbi:MAG: YezD family protein [Thermoflexaceae bacterium]|nr:YezD family protein [Thermoflexaceae bacterium]
MKDGAATGPSASERVVLVEVLRAMRALRFGTIGLAVQDGRVVHIEITEKKRL